MSDQTLGAYNIADLRAMAQRRVPKGLFEFVDRGNEDEVALRNNRAAFESIKLKPRALVDVSKRSQAAQSPSNWRMFRPALGSVRYISPLRST